MDNIGNAIKVRKIKNFVGINLSSTNQKWNCNLSLETRPESSAHEKIRSQQDHDEELMELEGKSKRRLKKWFLSKEKDTTTFALFLYIYF